MSSAALAAAFNLVCTGTYTTGDLNKVLAAPTYGPIPQTHVYRVDLSAGRWCKDACEMSHPIMQATPSQIVFRAEEKGTLDDVLEFVNREDGSLLDRTRAYPIIFMFQGKCEPAPFTGLPQPKF